MITLKSIIYLMIILFALTVLFILLILEQKHRIKRQLVTKSKIDEYIVNRYLHHSNQIMKFQKKLLILEFVKMSEQIQFHDEIKYQAFQDFSKLGLIPKYIRNIDSLRSFKRKEAIFYLSY
ncbi:MAG: hypothetical protein KJ971_00390, partial [Firmicutes bacterium]|nr:hypothetical protein [Bacillota bacterium]